jgi:7-carboxy-7-deazaguanine synthase
MTTASPATLDKDVLASKALRINEIFLSIQGESSRSGLPTVFVRLTGCPLRCQYCDTQYAFHQGMTMSINDILLQVSSYPTKYVTVTGGEPLSQKSCLLLLEALCVQGCIVSIETSGAIDVSGVDSRVMKVMDIKTPGSGEVDRNLYDNLKYIGSDDEIKFVICNRYDYEWSKKLITERGITGQCEVLFSPEQGSQDAAQLAEWVLEDGLNVRIQLQLHKLLWGNTPGK